MQLRMFANDLFHCYDRKEYFDSTLGICASIGRVDTIIAIDDDSALKVVDDSIEVVSEGQWKLFEPKE